MKRLLLAASIGLIALPAAGHEHERRYYREHCKPTVYGVGDADHLIDSAKRTALRDWQKRVIRDYGFRFANYEAAIKRDERCDLAGVGDDVLSNTKICGFSADPCDGGIDGHYRDREFSK